MVWIERGIAMNRPLLPHIRPFLYVLAGFGVGFLFLAEFALSSFVLVQVGILALAGLGLVGAIMRWMALELWPLFVAAALALPIILDARIVALPRCDTVAQGIACFAGARDVATPFAIETIALAVALIGVLVLFRRRNWLAAQ